MGCLDVHARWQSAADFVHLPERAHSKCVQLCVAAFAGMCMGVQGCCKKLVRRTDSCTKAGTTMHVHQQLRQVNDYNPARCHSVTAITGLASIWNRIVSGQACMAVACNVSMHGCRLFVQ